MVLFLGIFWIRHCEVPHSSMLGLTAYHTNAGLSVAFIAFWCSAKSNSPSVSVCNDKMMNTIICLIKSWGMLPQQKKSGTNRIQIKVV